MTSSERETDNVVYRWTKNRDSEVRATLSIFKGHRYADLRVWTLDADDVDRPTKKGISVGVADLPKLRAAVEALEAAAKEAR